MSKDISLLNIQYFQKEYLRLSMMKENSGGIERVAAHQTSSKLVIRR